MRAISVPARPARRRTCCRADRDATAPADRVSEGAACDRAKHTTRQRAFGLRPLLVIFDIGAPGEEQGGGAEYGAGLE